MQGIGHIVCSTYSDNLIVLVEFLGLERIVVNQSVLTACKTLHAVGKQLVGIQSGIPYTQLINLTLEQVIYH